MTIPSMTGLQTALSGLQAAQAAIDTTGQNIANANNPNYTRQVVDLTEKPGLGLSGFGNLTGQGVPQLGTGVDVATISRVRSQFLDIQYRAANTNENGLSTTTSLLSQVQTALAEPGSGGVSSQLTAFWQSWSALANTPSGPGSGSAKQAVVDAGTTLAGTFNGIESQLQTLQSQAAQQYSTLTAPNGPVQTDANQIAALNSQISAQLGSGQTPNDLLDQRDQLLDDLSQYGTVSVTDQGNGLLAVNFAGDTTTPLVNGKTANSVSSLNITPNSGGMLGALAGLTSPTGQISGYLNTLNSFASALATQVNSVHTTPPFFSVATTTTSLGATATTLNVNPSLVSNPSTVQTTATTNSGANDVAQALAQMSGGPADQSYNAFVTKIGSDVQSAQATQTTAQSMLTAMSNQRQSLSGVSLDEEMTHLVQYQQAYQASARAMTTIDSALDQLINHTGTVGL